MGFNQYAVVGNVARPCDHHVVEVRYIRENKLLTNDTR
jgi:hypothetical protein